MTGPEILARPRVLAIVAARDEADRVGQTVRHLYQIEGVDEVVVVADGCRDGTVGEAAAAGARVLTSERAHGKGGALEAACGRLRVPDVYLLVDADLGDTAAAAEALLDAVLRDRCDLAVGRLPRLSGGGFGIVKRMSRALIRLGCGVRASAPLSGQRAVRSATLLACRPLARGFGVEVAMTIDAARAGYRVREVDVDMHHRPTGRGVAGFAHRARQGADIVAAAAPRLLRRR